MASGDSTSIGSALGCGEASCGGALASMARGATRVDPRPPVPPHEAPSRPWAREQACQWPHWLSGTRRLIEPVRAPALPGASRLPVARVSRSALPPGQEPAARQACPVSWAWRALWHPASRGRSGTAHRYCTCQARTCTQGAPPPRIRRLRERGSAAMERRDPARPVRREEWWGRSLQFAPARPRPPRPPPWSPIANKPRRSAAGRRSVRLVAREGNRRPRWPPHAHRPWPPALPQQAPEQELLPPAHAAARALQLLRHRRGESGAAAPTSTRRRCRRAAGSAARRRRPAAPERVSSLECCVPSSPPSPKNPVTAPRRPPGSSPPLPRRKRSRRARCAAPHARSPRPAGHGSGRRAHHHCSPARAAACPHPLSRHPPKWSRRPQPPHRECRQPQAQSLRTHGRLAPLALPACPIPLRRRPRQPHSPEPPPSHLGWPPAPPPPLPPPPTRAPPPQLAPLPLPAPAPRPAPGRSPGPLSPPSVRAAGSPPDLTSPLLCALRDLLLPTVAQAPSAAPPPAPVCMAASTPARGASASAAKTALSLSSAGASQDRPASPSAAPSAAATLSSHSKRRQSDSGSSRPVGLSKLKGAPSPPARLGRLRGASRSTRSTGVARSNCAPSAAAFLPFRLALLARLLAAAVGASDSQPPSHAAPSPDAAAPPALVPPSAPSPFTHPSCPSRCEPCSLGSATARPASA
eukprot:scaffold13341_cov101-Isochrysis_galbana.AAC.8